MKDQWSGACKHLPYKFGELINPRGEFRSKEMKVSHAPEKYFNKYVGAAF